VSAVDGSGKCYTVGCNYTGTIVQLGNRVTKDFQKWDNIGVSTRRAPSAGSKVGCLREHCVGNGAGYYNKWKRVDPWASGTS
jgi:hypothetical protein